MIAGLFLQMLAHVMEPQGPFFSLGILSGIIQLGAVGMFALTIDKQFRA
jgi:hypothetical protein